MLFLFIEFPHTSKLEMIGELSFFSYHSLLFSYGSLSLGMVVEMEDSQDERMLNLFSFVLVLLTGPQFSLPAIQQLAACTVHTVVLH